MKVFRLLFLALLLAVPPLGAAYADSDCAYQAAGSAAILKETPGASVIQRGINLSGWWQDERDNPVSPKDIRQLHDLGFDFVRLPISTTWLEMNDVEEEKKTLHDLRCDIISVLNADMSIVLDLHAPPSFQASLHQDPNEAVRRIEAVWRKMQKVVDGLPPRHILISVYNEPLVETKMWWRVQQRIIEDLRHNFPDNTFIASAGPFDGWWHLAEKKPYGDDNIIYDFHFYEPLFFTHHGADWLYHAKADKNSDPVLFPANTSPIAYPVNKKFHFNVDDPEVKEYVEEGWDRAAIFKIIEGVAAWRDYNRVRIACLEFGVYRPYVDDASRNAWIRDVREILENYRVPWALWEYRGSFGLLNTQGAPDSGVLEALNMGRGQNQ